MPAGRDGRRDAGLGELAVEVQARRHHGGLDRVQHVEPLGQVAEAVPLGRTRLALDDPVVDETKGFAGELGKAGKHDDGDRTIQLPDLLGDGKAIHTRHEEIDDHGVNGAAKFYESTIPGV